MPYLLLQIVLVNLNLLLEYYNIGIDFCQPLAAVTLVEWSLRTGAVLAVEPWLASREKDNGEGWLVPSDLNA